MENRLDLFYLIVANLIDDENYSEVLRFLNISKEINQLIEFKVLTKEKLYHSNVLKTLPLKKIEILTNHLTNDIVSALNYCQWFTVNQKEKSKIKKDIYELLLSELKDKDIIFYKGVGFKVLNGRESLLDEQETYDLTKNLITFIETILNPNCLQNQWDTNYMLITQNNISYIINNSLSKYVSLKKKSRNASSYKSGLHRFNRMGGF
jgi:hypothetical protein